MSVACGITKDKGGDGEIVVVLLVQHIDYSFAWNEHWPLI